MGIGDKNVGGVEVDSFFTSAGGKRKDVQCPNHLVCVAGSSGFIDRDIARYHY